MIWWDPYLMKAQKYDSWTMLLNLYVSTCQFHTESVSSTCLPALRGSRCPWNLELISQKAWFKTAQNPMGAVMTLHLHPMKLNHPKTTRSHPHQHFGLKFHGFIVIIPLLFDRPKPVSSSVRRPAICSHRSRCRACLWKTRRFQQCKRFHYIYITTVHRGWFGITIYFHYGIIVDSN